MKKIEYGFTNRKNKKLCFYRKNWNCAEISLEEGKRQLITIKFQCIILSMKIRNAFYASN